MGQLPIKRTIERIPGGMMIVPLFTGALPILAVFYVCMGATIEFKATPYIVKKDGALFVTKILVGNLDRELREFLARAVPVMIPFLAFALGAGINLGTVAKAGLLGLGLGVFVTLVTGVFLLLADKLTGGTGVAGLSAASTAGNAAAVPAIVAAANPAYAPAAKSATVLVATSVVVTAILVPLVTAWWSRRIGRRTAPIPPPASTVARASTR